MKNILYILIFLIILSCNSTKTDKGFVEESNTKEMLDSDIPEKMFDDCFTEPDSIDNQMTVGCSDGYYKLINDQYLLRISSKLQVEYGQCVNLSIDSSEQNFKAELLIFEKGKASLTNICTDIIIVNAPESIKTLNKCYGQIMIGKSDPTDYYGNEMPKMTIRVDSLTFIDPHTGEEIKIENESFWKVLNTETPG